MSRKPKLLFFAEGPDWTVKSLLASFGDLQSVYETDGYGKYAARLHLAFSGTVPSLDVSVTQLLPLRIELTVHDVGPR